MPIEELSELDRDFLETFTSMEQLALNGTGIKSLANLPRSDKVHRVELSSNKLTGDQLHHLHQYASTLVTLKLASNQLSSYEDIKSLGALKSLKNLDLSMNQVTKLSDYKQHIFRLLPTLQVLDNHNKYGELVGSDDEDEDDFEGEGGEDEFDEFEG